KLSKKQKELLQEFAETMEGSGATHSPKHESWLDAVKRFFE
ncbi:MAG TPA: molecular chaperone DnaJ, partial [Methylophaga sp.]|nr:molecular chaperone DnaJ [Methylophaga sp.]